MKYIDMGGVNTSRLILGCMRIADKPQRNIDRLVSVALDMGINTFDNADIYGGGSCERLFGTALKNCSVPRDSVIIQTKCGIRDGRYDLSKAHIVRSVEDSLKRLNTDYIDVLILHRPDTLMRPEEIAAAFDELHKSGKVRLFGVSNFSAPQIELVQSALNQKLIIDQMQLSPTFCPMIDSGLNINTSSPAACDRDGGVLEHCRRTGMTIQTYGTMQCEFTDETGYYYAGAFTTPHANKKYFSLNFSLGGIAQKYGTTPEAVAVGWVLHHPARMQAIIGTTLDKRLLLYKDCCDVPLTDDEWYNIYKAAGHTLP